MLNGKILTCHLAGTFAKVTSSSQRHLHLERKNNRQKKRRRGKRPATPNSTTEEDDDSFSIASLGISGVSNLFASSADEDVEDVLLDQDKSSSRVPLDLARHQWRK
jgi:hypothetical protein